MSYDIQKAALDRPDPEGLISCLFSVSWHAYIVFFISPPGCKEEKVYQQAMLVLGRKSCT